MPAIRPIAPVITGIGTCGAAGLDAGGLLARLRGGPAFEQRREAPLATAWHVAAMPDLAQALTSWIGGLDAAAALAAQRATRRAPATATASLLAALEAWRQAGLVCHPALPERCAIVAAAQNVGAGTLLQAQQAFVAEPDFVDPALMVHGLDTFAASLVGELLGLRGETVLAGAAQASGLMALIQASRLLATGEADRVLVLGVPPRLSALEIQAYRALGALSDGPEPGCAPFDLHAPGFVPAETAAALVLEPADAARSRGAPVLARLAGWCARLHASIQPGPDLDSEVAVMRAALAMADCTPSDVALVSAHATGTALGDRTEAEAILRLFGGQPLVNAPKGLLGHALPAAGVVETVACVLQMRERWAHGNAGLRSPMVAGLRYVPAAGQAADLPVVVKTGFGFGGFNAAVVLTSD